MAGVGDLSGDVEALADGAARGVGDVAAAAPLCVDDHGAGVGCAHQVTHRGG